MHTLETTFVFVLYFHAVSCNWSLNATFENSRAYVDFTVKNELLFLHLTINIIIKLTNMTFVFKRFQCHFQGLWCVLYPLKTQLYINEGLYTYCEKQNFKEKKLYQYNKPIIKKHYDFV